MRDVYFGGREARAVAEGEEVTLQVAAGAVGLDVGVEREAGELRLADGAAVEAGWNGGSEVGDVRAGVVTGMWWRRVTSPFGTSPSRAPSLGRWVLWMGLVGDREEQRCRRIPSLRRLPPIEGTETSMGPSIGRSSSHSGAALRWLSTAPSPQARTAAIHRPWRRGDRMPHRVDAVVNAVKPTSSTLLVTALLSSPASRSCATDTTPCCLAAISASKLLRCGAFLSHIESNAPRGPISPPGRTRAHRWTANLIR